MSFCRYFEITPEDTPIVFLICSLSSSIMSLTQPQTLMGLLPQLKSMEDNIVSMIMELSTKLANLTDAHIFVLVDVTNQRRFRYDCLRRDGMHG